MAQQIIGIGAAPEDGTGDGIRVAFGKVNDNFGELYMGKAPLASPALTGTPSAPTAAPGTNTTQLATTAFIQAAVAAVINSAPGVLDTLDELAAALGDDANFAATIATALALKATLASPTFTGTPAAPTAAPGTNTTQLATTAFVAAAVDTTTEAERIRDTIAAALVAGSNITITPNDGADTITIDASVSGSGVPAAPVTGAPGAGSATPTTPGKGFSSMMQLRVGGCYLFRYDDGSAWEERWGFWTGTVITRPTNGFVASSTGSGLTLSSSATVSVLSPLGLWQRGMAEHVATTITQYGNGTMQALGCATPTVAGTPAALALADTSLFTRQIRTQFTSATTANANGGITCYNGGSSGLFRAAGFHLSARFGPSQIPTGPRLAVGLTSSLAALGADPSALTDTAIFGKDAADTNIQFMVNDNSGVATKTDTGIALAANTWYECAIWVDPAGTTVHGLLVDYTNSAIWYGTAASNLPTNTTLMAARCCGGLNGTDTGTAIIVHISGLYVRSGI